MLIIFNFEEKSLKKKFRHKNFSGGREFWLGIAFTAGYLLFFYTVIF